MLNPFTTECSPISELYGRARIKSKQNRQTSRSPVQSYREFQVKMIRAALKNNHIIRKEYEGDHKEALDRERRRSKYLGIQSQRYQSNENKKTELQRRENCCSTGKESVIPKEVHFKKRESEKTEKTENLVNFQGYSIQNVKSQRAMSYSSNYNIFNEQKVSGCTLPLTGKLKTEKENEKPNKRLAERKCSITNSLGSEQDCFGKSKRGSRGDQPRQKIDEIREEYFNGYQ